LATEFDEYGFFNGVMKLDQINWPKFIAPHIPDCVIDGIDDELLVYADSTGMNVKVKKGECRVRGHRAALTDTEQSLTIAAADATNPRYDLIVARVTYDDAPSSKIELAVLTGMPAANPIVPAITQTAGSVWEMALASVLVDAGAVTIAANKVTDMRRLYNPLKRVWTTTITLASASWSGTTYTYNTNPTWWRSDQIAIFADPVEASRIAYYAADIRLSDTLTNGYLTFTCSLAPTSNLSVKLLVIE